MIRWALGWRYAVQREIDRRVLWPRCKKLAGDLDLAKAAFAVHAMQDPAWRWLGENAIIELIDDLR